MDWQTMAPLTEQQTQSIADLQQIILREAPTAHNIDKTKVTILPRPELLTLPSNHKLRERYKKQMEPTQFNLDDDDDNDRYTKRPPKFDYIQYFVDQMTAQRQTSLQLTQKLKIARIANYIHFCHGHSDTSKVGIISQKMQIT